jgi:hypothetical protein
MHNINNISNPDVTWTNTSTTTYTNTNNTYVKEINTISTYELLKCDHKELFELMMNNNVKVMVFNSNNSMIVSVDIEEYILDHKEKFKIFIDKYALLIKK